MNNSDKAVAAGLLMGEGCIGIYRNGYAEKKNFVLRVSIKMADKEIIDWLQDLWPGLPIKTRVRVNRRVVYNWERRYKYAKEFLLDIQPYVIGEKLPQLKLAVEFQDRRVPRQQQARVGSRWVFSTSRYLWDARAAQRISEMKRVN